MNELIEKISADYDCELNISERLHFEAQQANSELINEITRENLFKFHKISRSINRVIRQF